MSTIAHFRHHVTPGVFMLINKISGALLVGFGAVFILTVLRKFF